MAVSLETLEKLRRFDTPTISNVIELFDVRPRNRGFMDWRIRANFPDLPPMVGLAATAAFRSDTPPTDCGAYDSLIAQVERFAELAGPAVMVFEDLDNPPVGATFGEVMCSVYRAFGSVGLITSGGGRDLVQVKALNWPVFTGSTICSHAYCQIMHVGLPVRVGGLVVHQGSLLHGDANGVTDVPCQIADEVADLAGPYVEAEKILLDYVRACGPKTVEGLIGARAEFQAAVAALRRQIGR